MPLYILRNKFNLLIPGGMLCLTKLIKMNFKKCLKKLKSLKKGKNKKRKKNLSKLNFRAYIIKLIIKKISKSII